MNKETKEEPKAEAGVSFGNGNAIAVVGIVGGIALALSFPYIILVYGQALGPKMLVVFVMGGLIAGGLIALTSAFFGLVMPRQVGGPADEGAFNNWKDWVEPGSENWSPKEWKDWGEKMKKKWSKNK